MGEQAGDRAAKTFLVRVYVCGCVLELGGVLDDTPVNLFTFPKCVAWQEAYCGDDLEAADDWAARHFEATSCRVEYRQA